MVDSAHYITEYTCRYCSNKRQEPINNTWLSINFVDASNQFINEYIFLENVEDYKLSDELLICLKQSETLVILKEYDTNKKKSYYLCSKPLIILTHFKIEISNINFLSITYNNGDNEPVILKIDKEWLVVGNELLGYIHVLRMLEYQDKPFIFNKDYVLNIIDSNITIFQLKSNQYLKMNMDGYIIEED
jgi:hypothetical protein